MDSGSCPYTTRKVDVLSDAWNEELQQNSAHGSKRSHWGGPIVGKAAKVHHDDLVCRLGLTIQLWVKRRGVLQLNSGEPHELAPKGAGDW